MRVIIIGSGFGGICVAIKLLQAGFEDITLLERADELGGVWRDNTYPGAACDVPAALYSYSFASVYPWKNRYATQGEILDYLQKCADDYGVTRRIRFACEVSDASFDDEEQVWTVSLTSGEKVATDVLISAVGLFNRARLPDIDGRNDFTGCSFHSSQWNHAIDLNGRRVAVIGTGASAVQLVPVIATQVEKLCVFQSSSQYVFPKRDPLLPLPDNTLHSRIARSRQRLSDFLDFEITIPRRSSPWWTRRAQNAFLDYLVDAVPAPTLRKKLVPQFQLGCKRVLMSNDWYPALQQQNVQLVDHRVACIKPQAVVGADGELHPVDVIIYSTGFTPADYLAPMIVRNGKGQVLQLAWRSGATAYLGMTVPGYSNFFMLYGPNTNVAGSIIFMLECQAKYIVSSLESLQRRRAKTMQVNEVALTRYDHAVQRRMHSTLLVDPDCHSYYKNADGRVVTQWPGFMTSYRRLTSRVREADYIYR